MFLVGVHGLIVLLAGRLLLFHPAQFTNRQLVGYAEGGRGDALLLSNHLCLYPVKFDILLLLIFVRVEISAQHHQIRFLLFLLLLHEFFDRDDFKLLVEALRHGAPSSVFVEAVAIIVDSFHYLDPLLFRFLCLVWWFIAATQTRKYFIHRCITERMLARDLGEGELYLKVVERLVHIIDVAIHLSFKTHI